jgi:hypothetical protein
MEECIIKAKVAGKNIQDPYGNWAATCLQATPNPIVGYNPKCITTLTPEDFPAGINKTEIQMSLKELVKRKIHVIQVCVFWH